MKRILLAVALVTASCHKDSPPAPSSEQAGQLNEAEDMLNEMSANEEGPEANASSPSNSTD